MNTNTKNNKLTDWDWTTLVAAWRYYEHRNTITSAMFPHEIVTRFFTGAYDEESCKRIARQFVEIDHRLGPDNKLDGWVGDDAFGASDRKAWRLFYFYLYAYLYGFKTAKVTVDGEIGLVEVFRADSKWYAKKCYELFGENVSPCKHEGKCELCEEYGLIRRYAARDTDRIHELRALVKEIADAASQNMK